jgi:hypothetical protein
MNSFIPVLVPIVLENRAIVNYNTGTVLGRRGLGSRAEPVPIETSERTDEFFRKIDARVIPIDNDYSTR